MKLSSRRLVLASRSPRRKEILQNAGFSFVVRVTDVPERREPREPPEDYVRRLSRAKAEAVTCNHGEIVLGADTVVVLEDAVLEKPVDAADAQRMLQLLSGQEHDVLTGIALRAEADRVISRTARTRVWFHTLTPSEIEDYVSSGEPMDKAGGYAIQGLASKFIERIEGCYFNVVGLPVSLVYQSLKEFMPD